MEFSGVLSSCDTAPDEIVLGAARLFRFAPRSLCRDQGLMELFGRQLNLTPPPI
jgi:hypothetical protein